MTDAAPHAITLDGPLSTRDAWRPDGCPAAKALAVVGTRSALLLMREALYGTTRFDDFVERVGITESVAAARLRELTDAGLLERVPYRDPGQRTRFGYRLTERGADLSTVVLALYDWGAKYLTRDGAGPLEFTHRDCGEVVRVEAVCDGGHRVSAEETTARIAPRR